MLSCGKPTVLLILFDSFGVHGFCYLNFLVKMFDMFQLNFSVTGSVWIMNILLFCEMTLMPFHSSASQLPCGNNCNDDFPDEVPCPITKDVHDVHDEESIDGGDGNGYHIVNPPLFQKGVLRTNCIDCLDRTNVAQYVFGFVALGHQLHALGYIDSPSISLDSSLADDLMKIYEAMGDTLALQYGGSAAHNKVYFNFEK